MKEWYESVIFTPALEPLVSLKRCCDHSDRDWHPQIKGMLAQQQKQWRMWVQYTKSRYVFFKQEQMLFWVQILGTNSHKINLTLPSFSFDFISLSTAARINPINWEYGKTTICILYPKSNTVLSMNSVSILTLSCWITHVDSHMLCSLHYPFSHVQANYLNE